MTDTIAALATPLGKSGIGVIRISGPDALPIVRKLTGDADFSPTPRYASLCSIIDAGHETIDDAVVTFFAGPRSFTGEDVAEVAAHGSPIVLRQILDLCFSAGARPADAGEFTLRALANGKLDLTEAEAIRDLIDAQTTAAAKQAVRQLRGEFSHELQPLKDRLLDTIVVLESALEFVEDDLPAVQAAGLRSELDELIEKITTIAGTFTAGRLIRDGLRLAIVGRPNVGKSSLFNALLGTERAIVTDVAGTTRDQLHERFLIENIPVSLIDTAGIRETEDVVESIGVERAKLAIADADLVFIVLDSTQPVTDDDLALIDLVEATAHFVIANKTDVADDAVIASLRADFPEIIEISARTGHGLDGLKRAVVERFDPADAAETGFLITDARHFDLLTRAAAEITSARTAIADGESEEIVLIGLHNALRYLGLITGETTTEDMLTRIFSTFCIGK